MKIFIQEGKIEIRKRYENFDFRGRPRFES